MPKKAGIIIVAASAAGLLALSPQAFANQPHDNGRGHSDSRGGSFGGDGFNVTFNNDHSNSNSNNTNSGNTSNLTCPTSAGTATGTAQITLAPICTLSEVLGLAP